MILHRVLVQVVVEALHEIFQNGAMADKVIEKQLKTQKKWGARDRRFFAESVYEIVRWWRLRCLQAGVSDPKTKSDFWRVWLAQATASGWLADPRVLDLVQGWPEVPTDFSAGTMRSLTPAERESIPDWLQVLGEQELGAKVWSDCMHALNEPAQVVLRVNTIKTRRSALRQALSTEGIETVEVGEFGLLLPERKNVFQTQSFKDGFFEVQDSSSQLVGPFLGPRPGDRVMDACAGAGGKTLHLAALMANKGKIVALDIHQWKLDELKVRAKRAGAFLIEPKLLDSSKVVKRLGQSFDRILLDVPCSGLGVLRRNPDSKWKLSPEKIENLRNTQQQILADYSKCLRPGGTLVYATCSILPSENQIQVKTFLDNNPDWRLDEEKVVLPSMATPGDGFYMARLVLTTSSAKGPKI